MKQVVEVSVKGIGSLGLGVAKALLADLAAVAKRHGFNQIAEGTSCEPGVLNGDFVFEPAEGKVLAIPVEIAKPKAKAAKAKSKAKAKPAKAKGKAKKKK